MAGNNIQEIVSQIVRSREFCEELERSVRSVSNGSSPSAYNTTEVVLSGPSISPVVSVSRQHPSTREEVINLFPSINRTTHRAPATPLARRKNTKCSIKKQFREFKRDVILLKSHKTEETYNSFEKSSAYESDISNVTEGAIDLGGPTREMFRLLLGYLKNSKIFEGDEYSKNLRFCNESLDNREYFEVGRIICLSIIHVGFGPCYLSNTLLTYLLHGSEFAKPDPSEIVDPDVHKDIEGVQNSTTLDELRNMVLDSQFFQIAGFRNVTNFDQKNQIVERAVKFYLLDRMKPALDQFAEGLDTVEFLTKMQQFPAELKKLLCHDKQHLNAENIKSLFIPTLSEIGSNRRTVETRILAFWWDYLLDCEEPDSEMHLDEIFWFATGAQMLPVLGFEITPTLEFLHDDNSPYPKANTCS